jgi:hypothetical protein
MGSIKRPPTTSPCLGGTCHLAVGTDGTASQNKYYSFFFD